MLSNFKKSNNGVQAFNLLMKNKYLFEISESIGYILCSDSLPSFHINTLVNFFSFPSMPDLSMGLKLFRSVS